MNWQQIILNLYGKGYRYGTISKAVGAKYKHIGDLARGDVAQPRFDTGMKIIQLHNRVCKDKHIKVTT